MTQIIETNKTNIAGPAVQPPGVAPKSAVKQAPNTATKTIVGTQQAKTAYFSGNPTIRQSSSNRARVIEVLTNGVWRGLAVPTIDKIAKKYGLTLEKATTLYYTQMNKKIANYGFQFIQITSSQWDVCPLLRSRL